MVMNLAYIVSLTKSGWLLSFARWGFHGEGTGHHPLKSQLPVCRPRDVCPLSGHLTSAVTLEPRAEACVQLSMYQLVNMNIPPKPSLFCGSHESQAPQILVLIAVPQPPESINFHPNSVRSWKAFSEGLPGSPLASFY